MRTLPHCCSELGHLHAGSKLEWLVSSLIDSACFWTISKSEEIKKWSVSVTDLKNCVNRSIFFGGSSPHKNSPPFLSAVQNRRYANQIVVQVWAVWLLIPLLATALQSSFGWSLSPPQSSPLCPREAGELGKTSTGGRRFPLRRALLAWNTQWVFRLRRRLSAEISDGVESTLLIYAVSEV